MTKPPTQREVGEGHQGDNATAARYLLRCFSSSQKSSFIAMELRPGTPPPPPLASNGTFSLIEACTHFDRDAPRKQTDTTTTAAFSPSSSVRLTRAL